MVALILALGCHRAEVVDACDDAYYADEESCLPCATDADCGFEGNACTETVLCANREESHAFIEIGCSAMLEYAWPADESCACQDQVCTWTGEWR